MEIIIAVLKRVEDKLILLYNNGGEKNMWRLKVEDHFDAAHYLRGYRGKCANMHGHTWKVELFILDDKQDKVGITYDFKSLKEVLKELLSKYDHQCVNDVAPFDLINPTAENISKVIYDALCTGIELEHSTLEKVRVYESPTTWAEYWNGVEKRKE